MDTKKILIGARIPESIVTELREYCKSRGILMNHEKAEKLPMN